MPTYRVECEGSVREVYLVDADSPEEAKANWHEGDLQVQESMGVGPVSVEEYLNE